MIGDPLPQYIIPATISFVATEVQVTPKSVETAEEREKLMFRVKLQIDPKVLAHYHKFVKTGVRGLGFVRTQTKIAWPDELRVKLPQSRKQARLHALILIVSARNRALLFRRHEALALLTCPAIPLCV